MIDHTFVVPNRKPIPNKIADDPLGQPSISLLVGGCGSGKSTCMANMLMALQKRHEFDSALFVTSNGRDPIIDSISMPVTTNPTDLDEFITKTRQSKNGTNHLLVLDDVQGSPNFKIMTNRSHFVEFVLSHRHFGEDPQKPGQNGVWIIMTAQTLKNSYTPQIRDQVKNWILYYPRNSIPTQLKAYDELVNDATGMRRAMSLVKSEGNHAFLFLNKHNSDQDRYYLGFKESIDDLN